MALMSSDLPRENSATKAIDSLSSARRPRARAKRWSLAASDSCTMPTHARYRCRAAITALRQPLYSWNFSTRLLTSSSMKSKSLSLGAYPGRERLQGLTLAPGLIFDNLRKKTWNAVLVSIDESAFCRYGKV